MTDTNQGVTQEPTVHSIHALVRILKAPDDQASHSISKIELAHAAWCDSSFSALNKGEVIGEWLLGVLGSTGKGKGRDDKNVDSSPVANEKYWELLRDVLTVPTTSTRPLKSWLFPILNRTPLSSIITQLLSLRHTAFPFDDGLNHRQASHIYSPARAALSVLWPLAEKRIGVDALTDCVGAIMNACIGWDVDGSEEGDQDLAWICTTVLTSYRNAFGNAGNKKKLYTTFLSTHFAIWLTSLSCPFLETRTPGKCIRDALYAAGTDVLFSLDALKLPLDAFFDAFNALSSTHATPNFTLVFLRLLPDLFASYLSAINKYRSTLFPPPPTASTSTSNVLAVREQVRNKGMEALGRWWVFLSGAINGASRQTEADVQAWKALVPLLELVEKERLFVRSSFAKLMHGRKEGEAMAYCEHVLLEIRDLTIRILEAQAEENAELAALAVRTLDVLVCIEYDLVGEMLGRVLAVLVRVSLAASPSLGGSVSTLLTHILEFHAKTRTVDTYALAFLSAHSVPGPFVVPGSPAAPFPLFYHLPSLSRVLRTSLTPSQAMALGPVVLQSVDDAWMAYYDFLRRPVHEDRNDGRDVKRRKVVNEEDVIGGDSHHFDEGVDTSLTAFVTSISHKARIAGTILANLPAQAYDVQRAQEDGGKGAEAWEHAGTLCWRIVWACLRGGRSEVKTRSDGSVKQKKKRKRSLSASVGASTSGAGRTAQRANDIVASAVLRLLYDVRARLSGVVASQAPSLGNEDTLGEAEVDQLLVIVRDEDTAPELMLEIIRTLMWHVHTSQAVIKHTQAQHILTVAFDFFTKHFSQGAHWLGTPDSLTRENLGLVVLDIMMDRWIHVIDALASKEQLETLLSALFCIPLDRLDENTPNGLKYDAGYTGMLTPRGVLLSVLRNAQFWELRNVRAVFHSSISSLTTPLSLYSLSPCTPQSRATTDPADIVRASMVYALLIHVPPEYWIRTFRAELVKRAIGGDLGICALLTERQGDKKEVGERTRFKVHKIPPAECADPGISADKDKDTHTEKDYTWTRNLTLFRMFLRRMWPFVNVSDHVTSRLYIQHLLNPPSGLIPPSILLAQVTVDLIELYVITLLRSQDPDAILSASIVISDLAGDKPFSQPVSQDIWSYSIVQSAVLRIIECLRDGFTVSSLSQDVVSSLKILHDVVISALERHINVFLENGELPSSAQISAWSHVLSFSRWLAVDVKPVGAFGLKLAATMLRDAQNHLRPPTARSEICSSIIALLFEELNCTSGLSSSTHLNVIAALCSAFSGERGSEGQLSLEAHIAKGSRRLPPDDFSHLLDILIESIGDPEFQMCQRERLIRLSMILLHDAPQGTLKVVQNFVTRCFNLFTGRPEIYEEPSELKMQCLEFVAKHCSDRPAAVRSNDLGSIWSFLHKVLTGSSVHGESTDFSIFHHIVSIVSALVRLRRDLIVHTLPHLSLVLRQLMMLTRSLRPSLGAKQRKLVTDSFPSWISSSQPLTTVEGRALARLLNILTVKTIPRTHTHSTASGETQKAESIAKPFAKHAGYVLTAYIDSVNDPLCVMTTEMRRELEPGLFSLCEMVGEHSRDALMLSTLDSSGKVIMKAVWKEYEKQRYVGKG